MIMAVVAEKTSHRQILKATGILGGAQVIEIIIRIIRNKVVAVLLGPMGVGILGLYQSTIELIQSTTGFGLNFSAVRDIAEMAGSNDPQKISRTILILRRWVWFTGLLGMVLGLLFRTGFKIVTHVKNGFYIDAFFALVVIISAIFQIHLAVRGYHPTAMRIFPMWVGLPFVSYFLFEVFRRFKLKQRHGG